MDQKLSILLRDMGFLDPNEDRFVANLHRVVTFPVKEFLTIWVEYKKKQLQDEQMGWRIAGAAVGLLFGLGDGFDVGDLLGGLAGGAIGSLGQEALSAETKDQLNQLNLQWFHLCKGSPINMMQKHGKPLARYLIMDASGQPQLCVGFQDGFLGFLQDGTMQKLLLPLEKEARSSGYFNSEWIDAQLDYGITFAEDGKGFFIKQEKRLDSIKCHDNDGPMHDVVQMETDYGPMFGVKTTIPYNYEY